MKKKVRRTTVNIPTRIPRDTVDILRSIALATGETQSAIVDRALCAELQRIRLAGGRRLSLTLAAQERTRR